jgi:hypothetical protein
MAHHELRFDLTDRVHCHANDNQQTRSTEVE